MGADTFAYDANGNLAAGRGGASYSHNSDNQLVSASVSGAAVSYAYDARGRRVAKTVGGVTTRYIHAGDMEIAETDGAGTITMRYIPGPGVDQRVAMVAANGDTHFYHADRLGNVIALADATGAVTDQYLYSPFGVEDMAAASGNPFRYTGRRYDPETGLYYYRARYYDPVLGRFLETDPVGYADQMNLYAYCGNDGVNCVDPMGQQGILDRIKDELYGKSKVKTGSIDYTMVLFSGGADVSLDVSAEGRGIFAFGFSIQYSSADSTPSDMGDACSDAACLNGAQWSAGVNVSYMHGSLDDRTGVAGNTTLDAGYVGVALGSPDSLEGSGGFVNFFKNAVGQLQDIMNEEPGSFVEVGYGLGAGVSQGNIRTKNILTIRAPWSEGFEEHGAIQWR